MLTRRALLAALPRLAAGGSGLLLGGCLFNECADPGAAPDAAAADAIAEAWEGVDPEAFWDCHVHLLGNGDSGSGAWVGPAADQPLRHPVQWVQHRVFRNAACLAPGAGVDRGYLLRLLECQAALEPGNRLLLFAFDLTHDARGQPRPDLTPFHVPNEYARRVAAAHPGRTEWVASVHPYREDAVEALGAAAAAGARAVKWLPPTMGIDPAAARCDAFYDALVRLGLPLITHGGDELAVTGADRQRLGNPLRLRRALERGVTVVIAHCASLGNGEDLDRGDRAPVQRNFDLFARLLDEPAHAGRLYGDLSSIAQINRLGSALATVVERPDWHPRLLDGSDYPLPGVVSLVSLGRLVELGYLARDRAGVLDRLRHRNPLLFDFVLKRSLTRGGHRLAPESFATRRVFDPAWRAG